MCCCKSNKSHRELSAKVQSTDGYLNTQDCDLMFKEFKEGLIEDFMRSLPYNSTQFQHKFMIHITTCQKKILQELRNYKKPLEESNKILVLFQTKCKALEGYFRVLNDFKSLLITKDLKIRLLEDYIMGNLNKEELIRSYFKEVKGSYELQGCKEINELIVNEDPEAIYELIEIQYNQSVQHLKVQYKEIIESEPLDLEIYNATVGQLGVLQ